MFLVYTHTHTRSYRKGVGTIDICFFVYTQGGEGKSEGVSYRDAEEEAMMHELYKW